ncbi:MAG: deoxyhypusine synthase family protein [Gammaproteobacteria bacterium]
MSQHISAFMRTHYRHFNAAAMVDATKDYLRHLERGGKMMITLAGAMSTAEIGVSLARMIREDKVHAITCTGANLEEDLFNLVAHDHYERVPHYRELSAQDEQALLERSLNRVTDTCIPEEEAMRVLEALVLKQWCNAQAQQERWFPHEYLYQMIRSGALAGKAQIDEEDSWMLAACEKNLPLYVPGWEDSTMGNMFAAACMRGEIEDPRQMRSGIEYMIDLAQWYRATSADSSIGFFQIGGGIAGDFPICVVPMLEQDMRIPTRLWGYFCQISDSTTSYGSYSGAVPNEKITWGKLAVDTPRHIIESDATIVAPLMFSAILENGAGF